MSSAQSRKKTLSEHSSLNNDPKIFKPLPTARHLHGEHIPAEKRILRLQMYKPQLLLIYENRLVCPLTSLIPKIKTSITLTISNTQTNRLYHQKAHIFLHHYAFFRNYSTILNPKLQIYTLSQ